MVHLVSEVLVFTFSIFYSFQRNKHLVRACQAGETLVDSDREEMTKVFLAIRDQNVSIDIEEECS